MLGQSPIPPWGMGCRLQCDQEMAYQIALFHGYSSLVLSFVEQSVLTCQVKFPFHFGEWVVDCNVTRKWPTRLLHLIITLHWRFRLLNNLSYLCPPPRHAPPQSTGLARLILNITSPPLKSSDVINTGLQAKRQHFASNPDTALRSRSCQCRVHCMVN